MLSRKRRFGGSHLSAAGVVGVSGAGRGLLGPAGTEMLVEPERGGSGGFSSSTSVDREQWDSSLNSVIQRGYAIPIRDFPAKRVQSGASCLGENGTSGQVGLGRGDGKKHGVEGLARKGFSFPLCIYMYMYVMCYCYMCYACVNMLAWVCVPVCLGSRLITCFLHRTFPDLYIEGFPAPDHHTYPAFRWVLRI